MSAATTIASVVGALGSVAGSLMSGKGHSAPTIEKPAVMPTPDDDAIKKARRRSISQQLARSGRESTILSPDQGDTLGAA